MKRSSSVRVAVEHAERRVLGAGQLARGLDHRAQDDLEVELGEERGADLDQAPETRLLRLIVRPFERSHPASIIPRSRARKPGK